MKAHGMDAERVDLNEYTKVFAESMRAGLRGDADAMPMIPTYLSSAGKLPRGEKAVVIDAGGTNFRTAVISFDTKGAVIEQARIVDEAPTMASIFGFEMEDIDGKCLDTLLKKA